MSLLKTLQIGMRAGVTLLTQQILKLEQTRLKLHGIVKQNWTLESRRL